MGSKFNTLCLAIAIIHQQADEMFRRRNLIADLLLARRELQDPDGRGVAEQVNNRAARHVAQMQQTALNPLHLMLGILETECVGRRVLDSLTDIQSLHADVLQAARRGHRIAGNRTRTPHGGETAQHEEQGASALEQFGRDLTAMAREGKLDPVIGRDQEIGRVLHILSKRRKNNVALVGAAGVGKTAIAELLAQRIAAGDVPPALRDKRVIALDLTTVHADTAMRGSLEGRIQRVIGEVQDSEIILFIDEMHTLIGGGVSLDVANMLKPALARPGFQCIGATTPDEYRKHIEQDSALERRFQMVRVEPLTAEDTLRILIGVKARYEEFHQVTYPNGVLQEAIVLSDRYITGRNQPDKALDLMDEAGAIATGMAVTRKYLLQVIEQWSGVRVVEENQQALVQLKERVIGQDAVCDAVMARVSGLRSNAGPAGVFLFLGGTGTGKTHFTKVLAQMLCYHLIRIDMQDFQDRFQVTKLSGPPPGYVGYDDTSQLAEQVRQHPQSVVLLDEIEKAHPDVHMALLRIFDEGEMQDSHGRLVNFRNCIIIMTANLKLQQKRQIGFGEGKNQSDMRDMLRQAFPAEFINRITDVLKFSELRFDDVVRIVQLEVLEVESRLVHPKLRLQLEADALDFLAQKGYDRRFGARAVKRVIEQYLVHPLSAFTREQELKEGDTIVVRLHEDALSFAKALLQTSP
ncbi:ATP-dependent Clp protease ATP-binding subunit [Candidatus Woesearchaeota archaeon]|nr:ATP-dependent Clp protease ATP-binding subunit [Candidatus Woesearchaeota archaeon]